MKELRKFMESVTGANAGCNNAYLLKQAKEYMNECREKLDTISNLLARSPIMFDIVHERTDLGGRYYYTDEGAGSLRQWEYDNSDVSSGEAEHEAIYSSKEAFRNYIANAEP